jgi:hypothetical protein
MKLRCPMRCEDGVLAHLIFAQTGELLCERNMRLEIVARERRHVFGGLIDHDIRAIVSLRCKCFDLCR